MRLFFIGSLLTVTACSPFSKKDAEAKHPQGGSDSVVAVSMTETSGTSTSTAYVLQGQVVCPSFSATMSFTKTEQSAIVYQDLTDCRIDLTQFALETDGTAVIYDRTNRTSQGFVAFDATASGQVVDTRLATGSVEMIDVCGAHETCQFKRVKVAFSYSELLSERIILANDLKVSELEVKIEKEPAPKCKVQPAFVQVGNAAPELVIDMSECIDTFDHKIIEFAVKRHSDGATYGIEELHTLITGANKNFDAANPYEIRLSVADLLAMSGTNNIFDALSMDLVLATRNRDGKSIKYYVFDNDCDPNTIVHEPLGGCDTAFAFGSTTLIQLGLGAQRWGWQIDVNVGDLDKTTPLYAGAGLNNIANATQVGVLRYSYDGSTLTATYEIYPEYGLSATHLYVGTTDVATAAPGQFTYQHGSLNGATSDTYTAAIQGSSGIKIVAHADVCDAAE